MAATIGLRRQPQPRKRKRLTMNSLPTTARDLAVRHATLTAELAEVAGTRGTTYADAHAVCRQLGDCEAAQRQAEQEQELADVRWRITPAGAALLASGAAR